MFVDAGLQEYLFKVKPDKLRCRTAIKLINKTLNCVTKTLNWVFNDVIALHCNCNFEIFTTPAYLLQ